MPLSQLHRIRWAVRMTLVLGVAASVVANVLHALENPISQAIAAWPPLALLLTVELISRVPVHRKSLAFARLAATATIAGIAAWVSYWHMVGVAARYGEEGASPYLLPLSVDGLIVVASICLVELGSRIALETRAAAITTETQRTAAETIAAPVALSTTTLSFTPPPIVPAHHPDEPADDLGGATNDETDATNLDDLAIHFTAGLPAKHSEVTAGTVTPAAVATATDATATNGTATDAIATNGTRADGTNEDSNSNSNASAADGGRTSGGGTAGLLNPAILDAVSARLAAGGPTPARGARQAAGRGTRTPQGPGSLVSAAAARTGTPGPAGPTGATDSVPTGATGGTKPRRSAAETVRLAAEIQAERPDATDAEIAATLGITRRRLRDARREAGPDVQLAA